MQIRQRGTRRSAEFDNLRLKRLRKSSNKRFKLNYFFIGIILSVIFLIIIFNLQSSIFTNFNNNFVEAEPTIRNENITLEPGEVKEIDIKGFIKSSSSNDISIARFEENKIILTPRKEDIGINYTINLEKDKDKTIYNVNVLPKNLDLSNLETKIIDILGEDRDNYGIYIKDLKRNETILSNAETNFPPASISKVPIALLVLIDIQNGKYTLDSTFPMKQSYKVYGLADAMSYIPNGNMVTLEEYISQMIKLSDNTGMTALEDILGGTKAINDRVKNELGVETFFREPMDATAQDIGIVWEGIYKEKYLNKELNDYLLDKLFNTGDWLRDRIPTALSEEKDTKVAHKVGQVFTEFGYSYNDSAIIYGTKTDIIIVVINQQAVENSARNKIQKIAKETYKFLNQ